MFSRLVVGIDGSPGADAALAAGLALGSRFHSSLLIASIVDVTFLEASLLGGGGLMAEAPSLQSDASALDEVMVTRCAQLLETAAARAATAGLPARTATAAGFVDEELLRLSAEADALIVGRRGETHGRSAAPGAVTTRIARRTGRVLVVAGDVASEFSRPLAVAEGEEGSRAALEVARRLAPAGETAGLAGAGEGARLIAANAQERGADVLVLGVRAARDRRSRSLRSQCVKLLRATALPVVVVP